MTISELIKILERKMDEHGDVPVELKNGREIFAVGCVFKEGTGVKPWEQPPVIAVSVQ